MLIAIAANNTPAFAAGPSVADCRPNAKTSVVASSAEPSTHNNTRLRMRERIGSGRTLRGTAHTVSIAC